MTQSTADHQDLSNGKDTSTSAIKDRASKTLEKGVETARETTAQAVDQARPGGGRRNWRRRADRPDGAQPRLRPR